MVRINISGLLRTCTLVIWSFTDSVIRLIQWCTKKLINDQNERHRSVEVVHRSENFLIVNKPYDMYINSDNPDRKVRILTFEAYIRYPYINQTLYLQNTLQLVLRKMLPDLVNPKLCHEFHFVHRLDYPTSGVMCIALNKKAARAASIAFENHKVQKFYLALVHGHIHEPYIVVDKAIG